MLASKVEFGLHALYNDLVHPLVLRVELDLFIVQTIQQVLYVRNLR